VRGETSDRVTAADLAEPAVRELLDRAHRAGSLVEVLRLVGELRTLPGVLDAAIARIDPVHPVPDFAVVAPVGPVTCRHVLRADFADAEVCHVVGPAITELAAAASHTLTAPCRPTSEASSPAPPLYRALTRNARAVIVVVDPVRGWTAMSESFGMVLGYDRLAPEVANVLDLVHVEDHPAAVATFVTACAGRDPADCVDLRLRTATGRWRTFEFAVRSFIGVADVGAVAYFGQDVTAQRAAERAVRLERCRLLNLVQTLRDGVLLLDEEHRVTVVNDALQRQLGLTGRMAGPGRDWGRMLTSLQESFADRAGAAARLNEIVSAGRAVVGEEIALHDGRVLELDFIPLDSDGRRRGTLVHTRDVTSRVAVRRGLEERNRALAEGAALNTQFVASVAHELRGPLSSVVAFGHLLGDEASGTLSEDQRTYLDVIDRNANRLLRLIEDLLLLSRLESRTLQLKPGPVHIPELIAAAVTERTPAALAAGLQLAADTVEGPVVVCDETRIHQVLDNLLGNALKFTPSAGQVTVRARPAADGWRLEVTDTGVGIPAVELPRLFSAFFRGSNVAAAAGRPGLPGTGLGLVVSRAIVELHGGTIQVASTEGVGTTVTVSLPAQPVRRTEVEREPASRGGG
jgi:PAS domain S-box-containing protein